MTVTVRLGEASAEIVDLGEKTREAIAEEAALRNMSRRGLVGRLLEQIAAHDLFAEVLDRGGRPT